MPSLKSSANQRALAKQNRLVNIKSSTDLDEALRTPGTPAYQKFWQLVWERQLNHAMIVQYVIMHLMQQATATQAERREFLQAYWQQYSAQALKDQESWENKPTPQTEPIKVENIPAAVTALQTALPLWQEFRAKLTERLADFKNEEAKIELDWKTLQSENSKALLEENAGKTILRIGSDGEFHEVVLDPAKPAEGVEEFLQAGQARLMDERLVKALIMSYDFDVKTPAPIPPPPPPPNFKQQEAEDAPAPKKHQRLKIADVMKHGNVLAELRANAACLNSDFEKPIKLSSKEENAPVDLSQALLRVVNHNRNIFKAAVVTREGPKSELEEQRNAALVGRKNRELDLLTRHLETQLCKIDCENSLAKADMTITRMETLITQLNAPKNSDLKNENNPSNQLMPRNRR